MESKMSAEEINIAVTPVSDMMFHKLNTVVWQKGAGLI